MPPSATFSRDGYVGVERALAPDVCELLLACAWHIAERCAAEAPLSLFTTDTDTSCSPPGDSGAPG